MKCVIQNVNDISFLEYLVKKIRDYAMSHVNIELLYTYKQQIVDVYPELKYMNMIRFFRLSFEYLNYTKYDSDYVIEIDPYKKYPGTDISLDAICSLINYGTRDKKPYPIYSQAFDYIIQNIEKIKVLYDRGM